MIGPDEIHDLVREMLEPIRKEIAELKVRVKHLEDLARLLPPPVNP
jgi:hypothetical protein